MLQKSLNKTSWGWAVPSSGQATFFWPWLRSLFTLIWNGLHIFGLPQYLRLSSYLSSPSYLRFSSYLNVLDILKCCSSTVLTLSWYYSDTVSNFSGQRTRRVETAETVIVMLYWAWQKKIWSGIRFERYLNQEKILVSRIRSKIFLIWLG